MNPKENQPEIRASDGADPLPLSGDIRTAESIAFLAFASLKGVGYNSLWNLCNQDRSLASLLLKSTQEEFAFELQKAKAKSSSIPELETRVRMWHEAQQRFQFMTQARTQLFFPYDGEFPEPLRRMANPPKWLFLQGNSDALRKASVAIVGTRNPSEDGLFLAWYVGMLVSACIGVTIVSGLAKGIDALAHQQAMRFGVPTVAFLGCGINTRLSSEAEAIREEICRKGGAIVSEYLPDQGHVAKNYVWRNRLQAALSSAVIPVEWSLEGGTAHTVRFGFTYERKVFGVKLPDWSNRPELQYIREHGGKVFTIPGEEKQLMDEILTAVSNQVVRRQMPLL